MNQNNQMVLYYVHDPMCSWCWAFVPTWTKIKEALGDRLEIRYLLGGLAPDSAQIMPKDMQNTISGYWKNIETRVPGTQFNYDFWTKCEPKRETKCERKRERKRETNPCVKTMPGKNT